eukprot:m.302162 g.302162  ORF g.302162 m.302162 type:complete len:98 (-) comp55230_c0_seq5:898-1191(-)
MHPPCTCFCPLFDLLVSLWHSSVFTAGGLAEAVQGWRVDNTRCPASILQAPQLATGSNQRTFPCLSEFRFRSLASADSAVLIETMQFSLFDEVSLNV